MADLLMDTSPTPEQFKMVSTMHQCGNLLLTVINDILNYSKLEAQKVELENKVLRLGVVLAAVESLMRPMISSKNIDFSFSISPRCPAKVVGDAGRIQQIVFNLLGNSAKFTKAGKIILEVDLLENVTSTIHRLSIKVSDTGIGMDEETQSRLFLPFMVCY